MELVLAKVTPAELDAVRHRPDLVAAILTAGINVFRADYHALEDTAATMATRGWFDTAVNGTEPLGFDDLTYGPAFALDVPDVRAVALGLVEEGWAPPPEEPAEPEADVDATARSLGAAAGWDPDEFATYGPMLASTWSPEFTIRLVHAVGAAGDWSEETTQRVLAAVAVPPAPSGDGLAAFFAAAAREGRAVVGGIAERPQRD